MSLGASEYLRARPDLTPRRCFSLRRLYGFDCRPCRLELLRKLLNLLFFAPGRSGFWLPGALRTSARLKNLTSVGGWS